MQPVFYQKALRFLWTLCCSGCFCGVVHKDKHLLRTKTNKNAFLIVNSSVCDRPPARIKICSWSSHVHFAFKAASSGSGAGKVCRKHQSWHLKDFRMSCCELSACSDTYSHVSRMRQGGVRRTRRVTWTCFNCFGKRKLWQGKAACWFLKLLETLLRCEIIKAGDALLVCWHTDTQGHTRAHQRAPSAG